jgi:hypothetical protein
MGSPLTTSPAGGPTARASGSAGRKVDPHPSPPPGQSRNPRRGPARCPRTCRAQPLTSRQRRAKCDANRPTNQSQGRIASMIFGSRACHQRN